MNFIADVAGNYDSLVRLITKMPNEPIVFVGDLIDRGPDSMKVVDLVRSHSEYQCLMANHEHMFIDWCFRNGWYEDGDFLRNGGYATLQSYGCDPFAEKTNAKMLDDAEWMKGNKLFFENEHVFASHAPWSAHVDFEFATQLTTEGRGFSIGPVVNGQSLLWNRSNPAPREFGGKRKIQVFGHNPDMSVRMMRDDNDMLFALAIDCSWAKILTGLHVNDETGEPTIYHEAY